VGPLNPPGLSSRLHLMGLLMALRRRWLLAFSLGLLCATVVGVTVWYLTPSTYTVRTLLHTSAVQPWVVFKNTDGRFDYFNYQRTQLVMLRTKVVLLRAYRSPDPEVAKLRVLQEQPDPIAWIERNIQADYSVAPEIMRIAMSGDDPEELKTLVKAVRDAYIAEVPDKEYEQRIKRLEELGVVYEKFDKILSDKRKRLREMAEALGSAHSVTLQRQQEFALKQLHSLQSELLGLDSQLRKARLAVKMRLASEQALNEGTIPKDTLDEYIKSDRKILDYTQQIAKFNQALKQIRETVDEPEKLRSYQLALAGVKQAEKDLDARREELRPKAVKWLQEQALAKFRAAKVAEVEHLNLLSEDHKDLVKKIDDRLKNLTFLQKGTVGVEELREGIEADAELVKLIGKQRQAVEVEMWAPRRVRVLEDPEITSVPSEAKRIRSGVVAALGLFGFVVFGVSWLEFRARRVNSADELVQGLGMRLVGTLPLLSYSGMAGTKKGDLLRQSHFTESLNTVRTTLLHTARRESLRVIMVTSALQGEGKSLVSCHLAASLARAGHKTLLIDGDLRRPSVHRLFNLEAQPGLSEILRGEAAIDDAVRAGPVEGLAVLPAGQLDEQTLIALARGGVGPVCEQLKASYEFIVVDSPPVLAVADALLIGQHADGVVFSVLRDVSRLPPIYAAYERLAVLNIRILGAVVNGGESTLYKTAYAYAYDNAPAAKA
jgi:capsular exopolysaccharide synthesis family protein